jgi:hypothetical protein
MKVYQNLFHMMIKSKLEFLFIIIIYYIDYIIIKKIDARQRFCPVSQHLYTVFETYIPPSVSIDILQSLK